MTRATVASRFDATILGTLLRRASLVQILVTRSVQARYRGTLLGFVWTLLTPLLLMAVYSIVFAGYLRVDVPGYPVFLFSAFMPWLWFSSSLQEGTSAILYGASLITRSRFDPELLPAVAVLSGLVHCSLSLPVIVAFALAMGRPLGWGVFLLPVLLALQLLLTLGPVTLLSAWNVYFRDVQHVIPTATQALFFATPILYPASVVPERFRFIVTLNPWAYLARGYQRVLYDGELPLRGDLAMVALAALAIHGTCEVIFARYRARLAEEL